MEKKKKSDCCCELCAYYAYDEESDAYLCEMDLDEDELAGLLAGRRADCPYFRFGDEYAVVRKQN